MSDHYLRLAEPPRWVVQYPTCSACDIDLTLDGTSWLCDSCGTTWDGDAMDGDEGTLPDDVTGPIVPNDKAWQVANPDCTPEERNRFVAERLGIKP